MSNPKFKPKDLTYDTTLPPFLARLQAQSAGGPASYQSARPKRPRNAEEDAEDEPVVFDEGSGRTLTRGEWEAEEAEREAAEGDGGKMNGEGEGKKEGREGDGMGEGKVAIGGGRKRKVGKVVGGDGDGEDAEGGEKEDMGSRGEMAKTKDKDGEKSVKSAGKKIEKRKSGGGKKTKKAKLLSFGDEE